MKPLYEEKNETPERETKEQERYRKFIGCILRVCELAGYHLEERIVVKDLRTGRVWR